MSGEKVRSLYVSGKQDMRVSGGGGGTWEEGTAFASSLTDRNRKSEKGEVLDARVFVSLAMAGASSGAHQSPPLHRMAVVVAACVRPKRGCR